MTTSMYCLYVGVDYTYIYINALAQGIKSFLASQVWFQAVAGARTYIYIHIYIYACMYLCIDVCMYVYMYVCICVNMYVCTYVRMCVCMYVCMYVYMYNYA